MNRLALLVTALLQIAAVTWMIASREIVLATGIEVKFETRPVDPADPFRGRYVALSFDASDFASEADLDPDSGPLYAILDIDQDHYATITAIHTSPPAEAPYLTITKWHRTWFAAAPVPAANATATTEAVEADTTTPQANHYFLTLPFDRYYMNEKAAPLAEAAYREALQQASADPAGPKGNYLAVRIRSGKAVARQLYIAGRPVEELLKDPR
jgi:uncharacterized membrane-anchored protein